MSNYDINDITTWPALILSSSPDAGERYAEILGIQNYIVGEDISSVQGLRIRAMVISPGYIRKLDYELYESRNVYDTAMMSLVRCVSSEKDIG